MTLPKSSLNSSKTPSASSRATSLPSNRKRSAIELSSSNLSECFSLLVRYASIMANARSIERSTSWPESTAETGKASILALK
ncbi:unnamed protein product [Haemonchus placei]|uniref:Uncharacterized protein n=1 Tax=Haemonchus placei TaxID=6290 RepID=A0A158QL99_HAEPC|nr:unnamed protein product [Haemonchus placei]